MTASLGVGGSAAKNLEKAKEYTIAVCANLSAYRVNYVRQNKESLQDHMPDIIEKTEFVALTGIYNSNFYNLLLDEVNHYKNLMTQIPEGL